MIDGNEIEGNGIEGLAAEYVIGTLTHAERVEVAGLRAADPRLEAAISGWENRLAPLDENMPDAVPDAGLFLRIEKRLGLRDSPVVYPAAHAVQVWRALALAACLALVIVSGFALLPRQTAPRAVALLRADPAAPAFLVSLDAKELVLSVRAVKAAAPAGKDYELWLIADKAQAPQSLGVLPGQDSGRIRLKNISAENLRRATLAVSVEPVGGSPTGAPTGPVVFSGTFL